MEVIKYRKYEKNTLQGYADILLQNGIILREFTHHKSGDSEWVNPPAKHWKDEQGNEGWTRLVDFNTKELYRLFCVEAVKLIHQKEKGEKHDSHGQS